MFTNVFCNKKILITGNTGFKGSWLSLWLLKLGAKVYGLSKDIPTNPSMFECLNLSENLEYYEVDVRNKEKTIEIIRDIKPDFIFHMAAQPIVSESYKNPIETISTNVLGTAHILEGLRECNHACVAIIITSDKCYDNVEWLWGYREIDRLGGKDVYSGSKGAAELICKSYYHSFFMKSNIKLATVRAGNVIGGGDWASDRIVPDCMRAWSIKNQVEIRKPNATRPWQHVLEPLSGYLALAGILFNEKNLNGESFNFGPHADQNHTVSKLIGDLGVYWGYNDNSKAYRINSNADFSEAHLLKLNCDKAFQLLSWLPTLNYEQTVEYTSVWYHKLYNKDDMYQFTMNQIKCYEELACKKGLSWTK
ncbi:MAG: CDP-glucose 4,6-dehydratase [Candidatus Ancaeobacter aquaticus]|nr:CDP-glucose 4,6-dehydratase [Candidatus Ancaeobacter aquaticus]